MNISEIGGEFGLIERITRDPASKQIIKGIGDDAAVVRFNNNYLIFTIDSQVEGDHFVLIISPQNKLAKKQLK